MVDEFIHHGAEISLLRDLDRLQKPISTDALTERAIRGDHSLLVDIESVDHETTAVVLSTAAPGSRNSMHRSDPEASERTDGKGPMAASGYRT